MIEFEIIMQSVVRAKGVLRPDVRVRLGALGESIFIMAYMFL